MRARLADLLPAYRREIFTIWARVAFNFTLGRESTDLLIMLLFAAAILALALLLLLRQKRLQGTGM